MSEITGTAFQNLAFATTLGILLAGLAFVFIKPDVGLRIYIRRHSRSLMWIISGLMVGFWWALGVLRFYAFHTSLIDTGTFANVLWNTDHGRFLGTAISWGSFLTQHFNPSLAILAIVYYPWQSPVWLIGLQALGVASGGSALYFIAHRRGLGGGTALLFSLVWLFSALVRAPVLGDFHDVIFISGILLWVGYLAVSGRLIAALILALIVMGFKEDIPVYMGGLGIILAWSMGKPREGYLITGLAIAYYFLVSLWIWWLVAPLHLDFLVLNFPQLSSQPGGILPTILSNPLVLVNSLLNWDQLWVFLMLFIPVMCLPFLRWGTLGLVPGLWVLLNIKSSTVFILGSYYHTPVLALVVLAAIPGFQYLMQHKPRWQELAKWSLLSLTLCTIFAYPAEMIFSCQLNPAYYHPHQYATEVQNIADATPAQESVTADLFLGTSFSDHFVLRIFPGDLLTDRIYISNRYLGHPQTILSVGGLGYKSLLNNPCFWFLSPQGTLDTKNAYMERMSWMEAEACGFPAWNTVSDVRASGNRTVFIPRWEGYGDRAISTPYFILPPGEYTYSIRARASFARDEMPVIIMEARQITAQHMDSKLEGEIFPYEMNQMRSEYQNLELHFAVREWGLTYLRINFCNKGDFWWDGVRLSGIKDDFDTYFRKVFIWESTAGAGCVDDKLHWKGAYPLFSDAISVDDSVKNQVVCTWDLGKDLVEGDYWLWYVDDVDQELAYYVWGDLSVVFPDENGWEKRRILGQLEIEHSIWMNSPNVKNMRVHLAPGERMELTVHEGLPCKIKLGKLWLMRDLPMSLDIYVNE